MNNNRKANSFLKRNNDPMRSWFIMIIAILIVILLVERTTAAVQNSQTSSEANASEDPSESWTWTPVPDEELAEIGREDSGNQAADLSAYDVDNNKSVLAMSQRALIEYLSEDNDFDGVILIGSQKDELCHLVMPIYVEASVSTSDVNFYYVDMEEDDYSEAIRTVLAGSLQKDSDGKPVLNLPLVLAVNGDQVVDHQAGIIGNADTLSDSRKTLLKERYLALANESAEEK